MPVSPLDKDRWILPDDDATQLLATRFAQVIAAWHANAVRTNTLQTSAGLQVHLSGNLGAGKTAFVRGTLRALGFAGRVRSPTYTLVEPYLLPIHDAAGDVFPALALHHFDLYRFSDPDEWADAGFDDYLGRHAVNLIEWPERGVGVLPTPDLLLRWDILEHGRLLHAEAQSPRGLDCLRALADDLCLSRAAPSRPS